MLRQRAGVEGGRSRRQLYGLAQHEMPAPADAAWSTSARRWSPAAGRQQEAWSAVVSSASTALRRAAWRGVRQACRAEDQPARHHRYDAMNSRDHLDAAGEGSSITRRPTRTAGCGTPALAAAAVPADLPRPGNVNIGLGGQCHVGEHVARSRGACTRRDPGHEHEAAVRLRTNRLRSGRRVLE